MPQGFGPLGERTPAQRLATLKWRTWLVAGAAASCLAAGTLLLAEPLHGILLWLHARFTPGGGALALHVPPALAHGSSLHARFQATLLFLSLMGVVGLAAGAFGRRRGAALAVVPLLLAGLTLSILPPGNRWLHVAPSQLERQIAQGNWQAARSLVVSSSGQPLVKDYVLAQIALRENDTARLALHGEPVLALVDKLLYGLPMREPERAALPSAVNFEPEVLWALDVGLHQQPETDIGIRWQAAQASRNWLSRVSPLLAPGLQLALGAGLLAGAWVLMRLWNAMRRRVWRIHVELHPPASVTELKTVPEAQAGTDDANAKAETAPFDASLDAPAPEQTPDSPISWRNLQWQADSLPERWQKSRKRIGRSLVALGLAGPAVMVFYLVKAIGANDTASYADPYRSRDARLARASSAGDQEAKTLWPCQFVGSWTSARTESVYKVTLTDDGNYTAEPIAAGRYPSATLRGKWLVEGRKIYWDDDATPLNAKGDINDVLEMKPKSFSLREVNGEVTHFNLIQAPATRRCPQR